ncbi:TetR/AcrR family transcriptional regulator [Catellatospora citrea]|uniref:TetR family transcriptional regulator n=1 Tax=Catellatospora citrea TaxID=53366 RepID=A0A8J3NZA0_9ACTN|nr:TetR/AcrR family transcriptional regulator [Catellatospora citrea]RKE00452.1 TetR family transcriptional regulator [Catellatospora citrea]GIF98112.1 TetR family transcriptional regulator [Catellatospora citrea]
MTVPAYRRDRARLPAAERRRQIMEATAQLIAERGFWGLSMQDVADRCGLTVPGLLHHVGSKDGLLVAVLEHRDAEDARSLAALLGVDDLAAPWADGALPSGVGLRQMCAALVRRNAGQPEIVRLFAVLEAESLAPSHPAHDYFAARQEHILATFTTLAKDVTATPHALARQLVAMMDGLQIQWLRAPHTNDLVQDWEDAAKVLFADLDT